MIGKKFGRKRIARGSAKDRASEISRIGRAPQRKRSVGGDSLRMTAAMRREITSWRGGADHRSQPPGNPPAAPEVRCVRRGILLSVEYQCKQNASLSGQSPSVRRILLCQQKAPMTSDSAKRDRLRSRAVPSGREPRFPTEPVVAARNDPRRTFYDWRAGFPRRYFLRGRLPAGNSPPADLDFMGGLFSSPCITTPPPAPASPPGLKPGLQALPWDGGCLGRLSTRPRRCSGRGSRASLTPADRQLAGE